MIEPNQTTFWGDYTQKLSEKTRSKTKIVCQKPTRDESETNIVGLFCVLFGFVLVYFGLCWFIFVYFGLFWFLLSLDFYLFGTLT